MPSDLMEQAITPELLNAASARATVANGGAMQQVKTGYTTAVAVQHPRQLEDVRKRLLAESMMAGESFYYGWGNGKDRIEGPSVGLAMAAARCFCNSAVDMLPVQETGESWIFSAVFVDLETGFTLTRQFRQSKKWAVYGKFDDERKDDIRFQIGQSKAVRNVVLNALPKWLIDAAVNEAKGGVRKRIEKFVEASGLPAAVDVVMKSLAKHGVTEPHIFVKCGVNDRAEIDIDHVVTLRGDLFALDNGQEYAVSLFPTLKENAPKESGSKVSESSLNAKLDQEQADANPLAGVLEALTACKTEKSLLEVHESALKRPGLTEGDAMKLDGWRDDCLEMLRNKKK